MSKQHNFRSNIIDRHNFNSTIDKNHNFTSTILDSFRFRSVIENISTNISRLINVSQDITFSIQNIYYSKQAIINLAIGKINVEVSRIISNLQLNLNANFSQSININSVPKLFQEIRSVTCQLSNTISANMILKQSAILNLSLNDINIIVNPTYNQHHLVSDWDASLLSEMDSLTLSELDYV